MKCPNCGFSFQYGYICPDCNVDVFVYGKTHRASLRLYNQGLKQAKNNDLTSAIVSLEQSVLFDKNNDQARNLLGLIYNEVGQIADALKHWIISVSLLPNNNPATAYIEILKKNGREMDRNNDAARFYNQAVGYLFQGSEDLAVIQLKRALEYNPDFVLANNLMALCCIDEKNYERAIHHVQNVLKIDKYNRTALRYAKSLNLKTENNEDKNDKKANRAVKKTDTPQPAPTYKRHEKKQNMIGRNEFIAFAGGIACTAAVLLTLVMPAMTEAKDKKITELQNTVSAQSGDTSKMPGDVAAMQKQLDTLTAENAEYKKKLATQTNLVDLQTATNLMNAENYSEAAATLVSMDATQFTEDEKAKFNTIKENVFPKAASESYTSGKGDFLSNNYSEAQGALENALKYASGEDFVDDAIYYLGKIAESKSDTETAKGYYQRVINEFQNSNQLSNAKNALTQLGE